MISIMALAHRTAGEMLRDSKVLSEYDHLGPLERTLYVIAAWTGLRRDGLLALRWRDVDWTIGVLRVRRSFSRGTLTTPKSRRSARAVPLADRVASELERHFGCSAFRADDDLVFCHPGFRNAYDASKLG